MQGLSRRNGVDVAVPRLCELGGWEGIGPNHCWLNLEWGLQAWKKRFCWTRVGLFEIVGNFQMTKGGIPKLHISLVIVPPNASCITTIHAVITPKARAGTKGTWRCLGAGGAKWATSRNPLACVSPQAYLQKKKALKDTTDLKKCDLVLQEEALVILNLSDLITPPGDYLTYPYIYIYPLLKALLSRWFSFPQMGYVPYIMAPKHVDLKVTQPDSTLPKFSLKHKGCQKRGSYPWPKFVIFRCCLL